MGLISLISQVYPIELVESLTGCLSYIFQNIPSQRAKKQWSCWKATVEVSMDVKVREAL